MANKNNNKTMTNRQRKEARKLSRDNKREERRYEFYGNVLEKEANTFIAKLDGIIRHNDTNIFRSKLKASRKEVIHFTESLRGDHDYIDGIILGIKGNITIITANILNAIHTNDSSIYSIIPDNEAIPTYLFSLNTLKDNLVKCFNDIFDLFLYNDYSNISNKVLRKLLCEAIEAFRNAYNYYINIFYIDIAMANRILIEEMKCRKYTSEEITMDDLYENIKNYTK